MLRYWVALALALTGALVSAACFGVGIASVPLILNALLGDSGRPLPELVKQADERVAGLIPDAFIEALPRDQFGAVVFVLGALLVLTVIGAAAKFAHTYLAMSVAMQTIANIRKAAFYRIVHLPMKVVVAEGTMDRISRIMRDSNQLRNGFTALFTKGIGESLKGLAALIAALLMNWKLCVIALLGAPILAVAIRIFGRKVKKASRRALVQAGRLLGTIMQSMQGVRVVKVHTAERAEVGRFNRVNKALLNEELSMRQAKALASPVVDTITMFGIVLIGGFAAWYVIETGQRFDVVLGTIVLLAAAGSAVRPLTQLSTDIHEASAAAERLADLLRQPAEKSRHEARPKLPLHERDIVFENVSFTYPGADQPAIDRVNLEITHGQTIAFVGPNGSGKTTLLSLIPRLFEVDSGRVLVDGNDIHEHSLKSLRQQIGVVTQEVIIFNDTIRNNIAYGAGSVTEEQLIQACRQAHAEEFILERPEGYDTIVGEQGVTLSGGQRQRIAIARAILRNPRILILDEATSMIDAESEAQITAALNQFCRNRTSLVIAHRLSTVINANQIVVMDAGRIVDVGAHDDLLARCQLYQQLCRTQLTSGESAA